MIRRRKPKKQRVEDAITCPISVLRELNNRSFYNFLVYFWPVICNKEFKTNWHIEYLCKELEKVAYNVANGLPKEYDLIINISPGTTKSIICSQMFPAWCWTKWYWMRFITASYSASLSLENGEYTRDLVKSDEFQEMYPELAVRSDKDSKSNFKIVKKRENDNPELPQTVLQGGNRYSTSVGATITGFHGDINIIDDPLNPTQAASEVQLETASTWMDTTLSTRKTDKEVTVTILVMQRLHQLDPTGHLLDKQKGNVKHICIPGEIRNYREQVRPKELIKFYKDDLMDPVRLNWKVLKELEADLGQYGFAGQIGQKPTPPGGGMFKVDHLQVINTLPAEVNFVSFVRYWDKAGTQGKGCFTAGVKMLRLRNGHFIVLDSKRGKWASEERERIIKETAHADTAVTRVGIEQEGGSGGKESAEATVRNLAGFSVTKDSPKGDKVFRADPFSVQVNDGNVMLLRGDWNHDYVEELRAFPFGTYKDQVDASAAGFHMLVAKKQVRNLLKSRR